MHKFEFSQKELKEFLDLFYKVHPNEYLDVYNGLKSLSGQDPLTRDVVYKLSENYPSLYQTIIGKFLVENNLVQLESRTESSIIDINQFTYIQELQQVYIKHKTYFGNYLDECRKLGSSNSPRLLFSTLCYNTLVVFGVNADQAKKTIKELEKNETLFQGSEDNIRKVMEESGYRYYNVKSAVIYQNRKRFYDPNSKISITELIKDISSLSPENGRSLLLTLRIGLGMKTASHFMRNLGLSQNQLAIIDSHILTKMEEYGVLSNLRKKDNGRIIHPSDSEYLQYEPKIREWSQNIVNIPLDALDLLLWHLDRRDI
jgi:N-glycosylase/DNA lyase